MVSCDASTDLAYARHLLIYTPPPPTYPWHCHHHICKILPVEIKTVIPPGRNQNYDLCQHDCKCQQFLFIPREISTWIIIEMNYNLTDKIYSLASCNQCNRKEERTNERMGT